MATIMTHAVCALSIAVLFPPAVVSRKVILTGMVLAMLPDADVLAFAVGIPYEHWLGHRGISHSILFAALCGIVAGLCMKKHQDLLLTSLYFFLCTLSHGLLDAMTSGGLGVGFFLPFDTSRYFFPWHPILVSPIGISEFFSPWGMAVLKSEIKFVWIPCFIVYAVITSVKFFTTKPLSS
jgi:inner membrane protein